MKVSKQWLENNIKSLNEWLLMNEKGIHFEFAKKKRERDNLVEKLIELEKFNLDKVDIIQESWPIENDTLDIREHNFYNV